MLLRLRSTLRVLRVRRLDIPASINSHQVWASVASVNGFAQLHEIDFSDSGQDMQVNREELAFIIRLCPLLRMVRLVDFQLNDAVIECLGNLKHLRHLELLDCDGIKAGAISQFFQRVATLETFVYKVSVRPLKDSTRHAAGILLAISQSGYKNLRELRLVNSRPVTYPEDRVAAFLNGMQNSRLSRIKLSYVYSSKELLEWLLRLPALTMLHLHGVHAFRDTDVLKALESRCAPISVVMEGSVYNIGINGTYIKTKDGRVHHRLSAKE